MMKNQTRWSPNDLRRGSSTGTRVSTGRFAPGAPRGGFADPVYQSVKNVARHFGYDPEGYFKQRLFGQSRGDVQWRYDLAQKIYGRPLHRSKKSDALPFLPRFPKKKYAPFSGTKFQKSDKSRPSFSGSGYQHCVWNQRRGRFSCSRPNKSYRSRSSYRKSYKIYRSPICRSELS